MANYNPNLNFSKPIMKNNKPSFKPELELPPSFEDVNISTDDDMDIDEELDSRLTYSFDSVETGIADDILIFTDVYITQSYTAITALIDIILNFVAFGEDLPYIEEIERNAKLLWTGLGGVNITQFDAIFNTLVVLYDISDTEELYDKMYDLLYT